MALKRSTLRLETYTIVCQINTETMGEREATYFLRNNHTSKEHGQTFLLKGNIIFICRELQSRVSTKIY